MDRDDLDLDLHAWRQARLGDEPIYCAAPVPSNPGDIICPGSDDELGHAAKVSKRLRYEEQGLRYLQGKPLRIISASLRGPFEPSAGWQNPWLTEPSAKHLRSEPAPSQPALHPVIGQPTYKDIARLSEEEGRTTPGADNSMLCHLPSPQSNHNLDLLSGPLDSEKRIQIQAWANDLPSTLEKDEFWAPDQGFDQQNDEHSRKRPAGKEWLKTKRSKRTRPNNSPRTATMSTPTPVAASQSSARSISMPPNTSQGKKTPNQSFELATPSSSVDHKQRDSFVREESEGSTGSQTPTLGEIIPDGSQGDYSDVPMSGVPETPGLDIEVQHQDRELLSAEDASEEVPEQRSRSPADESEPTPIGNTSFESCIDDSFHYRARPPKAPSPPSAVTDAVNTDLALRPNVNETPESSKHEETVPISPAQSEEQKHLKEPDAECQGDELPNASPQGQSPVLQSAPDRSEAQPNITEGTSPETQVGLTNTENPTQAVVVVEDMALSITTEHVTANADLNVNSSASSVSLSMFESQVDQKACSEVEECPKTSERLVDEGTPFVENPMAIDRCPADEMAKTPAVPHSPRGYGVGVPEAGLTTSAGNNEGSPTFNQASEDRGSDVANDSAVIPISQLESGVTEVNNTSPLQTTATCATTLETITNDDRVIKFENVEVENREAPQATPERLAPSIEPQSPWVPDVPPVSTLEERYIKSEPIEDETPSSLPQSIRSNQSSPRVMGYGTPGVPPSQQSPWAGDLAETVFMGRQPRIGNSTQGDSDSPRHSRRSSPRAETYPTMSLSQPSILAPLASDSETEITKTADSVPSTPITPTIRPTTPEPCISIKSFANFNTPSPQCRRTSRAILQSASSSFTNQRRGILVGATPCNPWGSARSSGLRVSFAPLPHEDDNNDIETSPSHKASRAASPPPQEAALEVDPEEVDGKFQNHFDTVKRRASSAHDLHAPPKLGFVGRLLPSLSQQQQTMSPGIGAMAAAFREADARRDERRDDMDMSMTGKETNEVEEESEGKENLSLSAKMDMDITMNETKAEPEPEPEPEPLSPWRGRGGGESQPEALDDVADVIGNLNEFLDSWDVDTALAAQAREIC
ncbi:hypothetical protein F5X96DRAFT_642965 [Biscogniauxia mediterranea]|nr:hypothetical protein F5X96DRAFT_642965 [Biscogniauxia mediterranea]